MRDKVFAFAKARYDTNPEYLWDSSPDAAVLRHRRNRKWYAIVMLVRKSSLGLDGGGEKWVVNVKASAEDIEKIPYSPGFLPGYHMNKKYWMTILLDGSVSEKVICDYIVKSYELTK